MSRLAGARPLVAVAPVRLAPGRVTNWTDGAEAAGGAYLAGLRRAGGLPAVLGGPDDVDPEELLEPFAALVLLGGADVDPGWYGQEPHPCTYGIDRGRDRFEMGLIRQALMSGLPVLAICRGLQVLNVALGGTLHQHLPDIGTVAHGVPIGSGEPALHRVEPEVGSRLAQVEASAGPLGRCVSIHHQAVAEVGHGLVVTGRSADGVVEALETPPGGPWCLAVQWHPERSAAADPAQQGVFDHLVRAAAGGPALR